MPATKPTRVPDSPATPIVTVFTSSSVGDLEYRLTIRCGPPASPSRSKLARFSVTPPPILRLSVTRNASDPARSRFESFAEPNSRYS